MVVCVVSYDQDRKMRKESLNYTRKARRIEVSLRELFLSYKNKKEYLKEYIYKIISKHEVRS